MSKSLVWLATILALAQCYHFPDYDLLERPRDFVERKDEVRKTPDEIKDEIKAAEAKKVTKRGFSHHCLGTTIHYS